MALEKQVIPVNFDKGLDTKSADQQALSGSFLTLENIIRRKNILTQKRNGFDELPKDILGGGSVPDGILLHDFNDEILLSSSDRLYSYNEVTDSWIDKGLLPNIHASTEQIVSSDLNSGAGDIAIGGGYKIYTYSQTDRGTTAFCRMFYTIVDEATGNKVFDSKSSGDPSGLGFYGKVVALADRFVLLTKAGTEIRIYDIEYSDIANISPKTIIGATGGTHQAIGIENYENDAVYYYRDGTASNIHVGYITSAGELGDGLNGRPAPIVTTVSGSATQTLPEKFYNHDIVTDSANNRIGIVRGDGALYISDDLVTTSYTTFTTGAVEVIGTTSAIAKANGDIKAFFHGEHASTGRGLFLVNLAWSGSSIVVTGIYPHNPLVYNNIYVTSRCFEYNGKACVIAQSAGSEDTQLDLITYIINEEQDVLSRILVGVSGPKKYTAPYGNNCVDLNPTLVTNVELNTQTGMYEAALTNLIDRELTTGTPNLTGGIASVSLDLDSTDKMSAAKLSENLLLGSSLPTIYDGVSTSEHGFNLSPEGLTFTPAAGGSGTIPADTYYAAVVYEWTDRKGQTHYSTPSITQEAVLGAVGRLEVTYLNYTLTKREDIRVGLYIGTSPSIMYKVRDYGGELPRPDIPVGIGEEYYTVQLTSLPADYTAGTPLYTTGGLLENTTLPPISSMTVHKDRLFFISEGERKYRYTKRAVNTEGVFYSDVFEKNIGSVDGAKAVASMDDKLIIFTNNEAYYVIGEGPNDDGKQDDLRRPEKIPGNNGCTEPRSIINIPNGILFKSKKGLYLLDRGLTTKYLGAPVEDFNDLTITSATLLEDTDEVRFTTSDGRLLVYHYFHDTWSVFTNYESVSGDLTSKGYATLKLDGTVRIENDSYSDNGSDIQQLLETNWFSFAGIQGFQRIYEVAFTGNIKSNHTFKVEFAYNFDDNYTETKLIVLAPGDDQFTIKPARQKCTSIKLRISDVDDQGGESAGFELTAVSFLVGKKNGLNKAEKK